jgi:hypothetical protein
MVIGLRGSLPVIPLPKVLPRIITGRDALFGIDEEDRNIRSSLCQGGAEIAIRGLPGAARYYFRPSPLGGHAAEQVTEASAAES